SNANGQLGDGTVISRTVPQKIGTDNDWNQIAAGSHTFAIKSDGTLWGSGLNSSGQLGDGKAFFTSPSLIKPIVEITQSSKSAYCSTGSMTLIASEGLSYKAAQRGIDVLLRSVAEIGQGMPKALSAFQFESEQVAQVDSKDMSFAIWHHLAQRCHAWLSQDEVKALVITHGTDTLEETAYFLSRVIAIDKPIVLTCAMRPANFKDADGPQNLRDALTVAAMAKGAGVWLVAAGEIHHSQYLQKVHPTRLNAFDSGETGAAGTVQQDQVAWSATFKTPSFDKIDAAFHLPEPANWPWVEIVMNHVQANAKCVDLLVAAGVQGLVIAGTGNGSDKYRFERRTAPS
ncbi:MAG: L-asparaginase precursor, partial [Pseudomonadota bacterium]